MSVPTKIAFREKCNTLNQELVKLQDQQESLKSDTEELNEKLSKLRNSEKELNNAFEGILNEGKECIENISTFLNNLEKDSQEYKPFNTFIGEMKSLLNKIILCIFNLTKGNQKPSQECVDIIGGFLSSMKPLEQKLEDAETFLSENVRVKRKL